MKKILLIEDDNGIQTTIKYYLQTEGFIVETASRVKEGLEKVNNNSYNIILLDINLPDGTGYYFYKKLKEEKNIPVIFLTALDEEKDIVKGFELGADDYITKPFHAGELLSRIKNVLRHNKSEEYDIIKIKNIEINLTNSKVYKDDKEIELKALEYKILVMLFENRGRIISREQILSNIWDKDENYVNDNTLTVYIKRIREKIEKDANNPEIIKTIRGLGYKIEKWTRNKKEIYA